MASNALTIFANGLAPVAKATSLTAIQAQAGWYGLIREPYAGAFQRHVETDAPRDLLGFPALFACITLIASDISKLRIKLVEEDAQGICTEIRRSAFSPVLKKPNHYQSRIQFLEQWILSLLLHGNTYILKGRDARGVVVALYILDATRVTPLVAENGDVYYRLAKDELSRLSESVEVPASEIIHDRMNCLWHPLMGIPPLYAAAMSATQGRRILSNSSKFFENMSRPSGVLTAPGAISNETALRIQATWDENFGGSNVGRTAVVGDGLKYEAMTIPADQAQLIEQLELTATHVAITFHVPLFKIGGPKIAGDTVESLNQIYYSDCLQARIEAIELCLDEGLKLPETYYTELDLDGLIRMDKKSMVETLVKGIRGTMYAPNEARKAVNLPPVEGGDEVYAQHQDYSIAALAKRDAKDDPFSTSAETPAEPADDGETPAPANDEAYAAEVEARRAAEERAAEAVRMMDAARATVAEVSEAMAKSAEAFQEMQQAAEAAAAERAIADEKRQEAERAAEQMSEELAAAVIAGLKESLPMEPV